MPMVTAPSLVTSVVLEAAKESSHD
jgi:hypothetical protein